MAVLNLTVKLLFSSPFKGGQEGDGDLPEQYNYLLSMIASYVSKKLFY